MRKKIEKLVFAGDLIENELERIRIKINEIIDYLNSQPKAEEYEKRVRIKGELSGGKRTLEQIRGEFDKERVKEWDRTAVETYKQATQDTPEQKEEWEKELGKLMSTWGKVLSVNKGRIGAGMQTAMYLKFYHFIKQLLSEREREVLESMRDWVIEYYKDTWNIRDFDAEISLKEVRNGLES